MATPLSSTPLASAGPASVPVVDVGMTDVTPPTIAPTDAPAVAALSAEQFLASLFASGGRTGTPLSAAAGAPNASAVAASTAKQAEQAEQAGQEAVTKGKLLDKGVADKLIVALSLPPPVFLDQRHLLQPASRELKFANHLLAVTRFETLCSVEQSDPRKHTAWGPMIQKATVVALRWPGTNRAFAVFTEQPDWGRSAEHLYVINDKHKAQAVVMLQFSKWNDSPTFSEQTKSGIKSLRGVLPYGGQYGIDNQVITTLLLGGAKAAAGLLPHDFLPPRRRAHEHLRALSTALKNPPAAAFAGIGQKNPSISIGSGVSLLLWTPVKSSTTADAASSSSAAASGDAAAADDATGSKAAGKKKVAPVKAAKPTTGVATRQLLQAIAVLAPPTEAAPRKPSFKMAKVADPETSSLDRSAGWGGDCGRFNDLGVEIFLQLLESCTIHTRLVLTEFTNKSFRMLRLEPELFSCMKFSHYESTKMTVQLMSARYVDAICCPASHFANLLQAKKSVVKHVAFVGGTPLTAIKACIKLIGSELTTLSLRGEANVNSLTIKEVGKQCPNLTYLDLNCSKNLDVADEDVIIEAVRGMKQLQTLRLAPFGPFNTFIGDWRFVKGHLVYNTPEMEYESQQWEIDMDDHDYCDGSESDVDMLGSTKLRELQSLLPRNCKLTNNGKWAGSGFINESWGTAFDEHAVCCA